MKRLPYTSILILFFIFTFTSRSSFSDAPAPKINIAPQEVDLKIMKKNEVKYYKIIVGNTGKGDLYIYNVHAPNEKTGLPLNKNAIKPGKKIELTFFYKATINGKIKDYVYINSNDSGNPSIKILLKGEVK
jgi:hypothetical protein